MTAQELLVYHAEVCAKARALMERKNHDYANPEGNPDPRAPFRNFLQVESLGICSVEEGFLVRLSDKFSRVSNLVGPNHQPGVADESIEDTILDEINYRILLLAYMKTKAAMSETATHTTNGTSPDISQKPSDKSDLEGLGRHDN